jgi:pimeloyl-ACP methyl ester carboxylesterase
VRVTARIVLVHGAATTSRVWDAVRGHLAGLEVLTPERPCTGDLDREVDALAGFCEGAVVGGVSGGATLGLALAAVGGVPLRAAVLHEPAAGSLAPGLLAPFVAAYRSGGVAAFGAALYGPAWQPEDAPEDAARVGRDLAMFSRFEPAPLADPTVVTLTVGTLSADARQRSVQALSHALGVGVRTVSGTAHAVHLEQPAAFAALLREAANAAD